MTIQRALKHLLMSTRKINDAFPADTLNSIEAEIKNSEQFHSGKIRFVVEARLSTVALIKCQSSKDRAIELFSQLRIWDTEHNNGVLIYLLLADRAVEIVADRGIHGKVSSSHWQTICRSMENNFKDENYINGALLGIILLTQSLKHHFQKVSLRLLSHRPPHL